MMTRRDFCVGATAVSAGCASDPSLFTASDEDFDENAAVLLSDIHVAGDDALSDRLFTRTELDRRVAEILALRPLPRHVIHFGDLSLENGDVRDYLYAAKKIRLLEDAGIRFVHMMGNHDRRGKFASVFPDVGQGSPVQGRYVSVVPFADCDLLLLDSLDAAEDHKRDDVPGRINEDQQEWLAKALPAWKRPVIVGAHHPFDALSAKGRPLADLLVDSPNCVGWINGHRHVWNKGVCITWGRREDTIRTLELPSAGFFLDIGFVKFRVDNGRATAELVQKDYFFFGPQRPGERRPEVWDAIVSDNRGERCSFPLKRTIRPWAMGPS